MLVNRNSVETRNALQYLVLVKNSMYCAQVSKGVFVADASLKKLEVKTPGSFCYCLKFACIFFFQTLDFSIPVVSTWPDSQAPEMDWLKWYGLDRILLPKVQQLHKAKLIRPSIDD